MAAARDIARQAGEALHRFHGGLRLRHNKRISCTQPVTAPPMPTRLVVPLLQHHGVEAEALVSVGERVLGGQRIGLAGATGAHVHAPTSGTVEALEDRPIAHPSGQAGPAVVIATDGLDEWISLQGLPDDTEPSALRERLRDTGVVGLGGAVFPTARKVEGSAQAEIHTLLLNGAECEPYISCDEMLMREEPDRIVRGARILMRAAGANRCIIAIEDQMGAVRESLLAAVDRLGSERITVKRIQTIYPEGGERQLIQVLTGLEVPAGQLPQALGLLVQNVGTAAAAADAVETGRPLVDRIVTVTGNGVGNPRNFRALLGTPVADLVAAAGGYTEQAARLIVGGPMMGYSLSGDDEPVVKATNCLLVPSQADVAPPQAEMPCIRCGECQRVCPANLMPQSLHFYLRSGQWESAAEWGVEACIECGCCDFVCPSHIPLASWFRHGKGEVRRQREERVVADRSRRRFEAREARQEAQKRARQERLDRRKQKLADQDGRKAQVAAAIERARQAREGSGEQE